MLIIIWSICFLTFITLTALIFQILLKDNRAHRKGTIPKKNPPRADKEKLPVELYRWATTDDEAVCDDCRQRAAWPSMDIADWMKAGLPGTPEAQTKCKKHCRCKLVPDNRPLYLDKKITDGTNQP